MPYDIEIQSLNGVPPPYTIRICEPGFISCVSVITGWNGTPLPYTILYSQIPPQFQPDGTPFVIQVLSEDQTYQGDCEPFVNVNQTQTPTPTNTQTPTVTPTNTVTPTSTRDPEVSPSQTPTVTPTNTVTPTVTSTSGNQTVDCRCYLVEAAKDSYYEYTTCDGVILSNRFISRGSFTRLCVNSYLIYETPVNPNQQFLTITYLGPCLNNQCDTLSEPPFNSDPCSIFFISFCTGDDCSDLQTQVWLYDKSTTAPYYLSPFFPNFPVTGGPCGIANTQNEIFILTLDFTPTQFSLYCYQYTTNPFTVTLNNTFTYGQTQVGFGLEYANGVLITDDTTNIVTINPNTGVRTTLFAKQPNRTIYGGILYSVGSTGSKLICIYEDTNTNNMYITQHTYPTGTVEVDILIYDSVTDTGIKAPDGLYTLSGDLYVVNQFGHTCLMSPTAPYTYTFVSNLSWGGKYGASNDATCNTFEFIV